MIDAPLALGFAAGMLAVVNPCGFAMLPAYLSFFVGTNDRSASTATAMGRALAVGATVSGGFLLVFGITGAALTWASISVARYSQWISVVIGAGLVVLGIAMLRGYEPTFRLPKLDRGGRERSLGSMFVFGVSYAVASISCTLPIFTGTVTQTFRRENFVSGFAVFGAYSAGMAVLLLALTVTLALTSTALAAFLRRALPYVNRVGGAFLVLAGAYVSYYAWIEIRTTQLGDIRRDPVVDRVTGISDDLSAWIQDTGPTRLGLVLALIVAAAGVLFAFSRRTAR